MRVDVLSLTAFRVGRRMGPIVRRFWLPALGVAGLVGVLLAVNPATLWAVLWRGRRLAASRDDPLVVGIYIARRLGWWVTLRCLGLRVSAGRAAWALMARPLVFLPFGDLGRVAASCSSGGRGGGWIASRHRSHRQERVPSKE